MPAHKLQTSLSATTLANVAMLTMYTHRDSSTMKHTHDIPRLVLPRTMVMVLWKLLLGDVGDVGV